jgi:chemotaxis signal transduction protein
VDSGDSLPRFQPGEYLTFRLARQDFAIYAGRVRGILPWHELVSDGLSDTAGVAAIRGHEFPVVDLRRILRLPRAPRGRSPAIIAVEGPVGSARLVGFVADTVSGVITVRGRDYRRGKIRAHGRPRAVLDPDLVVTLAPRVSESRPEPR